MSSTDYFLKIPQGEFGPYTINQVRAMWNDGRLTKANEFRCNPSEPWLPLSHLINELETPPPLAPPLVVPPVLSPPASEARDAANRQILFASRKKSGLLAALLNFVLPGTGYMYCGNVLLGIAAFLIVVFALVLTAGYAVFFTVPVMLIDGVLCANRANNKLAKELMR